MTLFSPTPNNGYFGAPSFTWIDFINVETLKNRIAIGWKL